MIKAIISDLSKVLLLPVDNTIVGGLNTLHEKLQEEDDYDFWSYFKLNEQLFEYYKTQSKNIDIYIFTTKYIQEQPSLHEKLKETVKDIFTSARLDIEKSDPHSYTLLAEKIGLEPSEILFIDDNLFNTNAAKEAGINVILFNTTEKTIDNINTLLEESKKESSTTQGDKNE